MLANLHETAIPRSSPVKASIVSECRGGSELASWAWVRLYRKDIFEMSPPPSTTLVHAFYNLTVVIQTPCSACSAAVNRALYG